MPALVPRSAPRRVANPKADPRFVAVTEQVKSGANKLKKHVPPAQKAREASKSAKAPPNERLAGAKAKVVDAVKEAPAPKPQPSSFKALLRAEIEKVMPKTLGDTEKFMKGEQAGAMKGSLAGNVGQQKEAATGPVDAATKKAPDPGSVPATPSAPLPAEPAPQAPPVAGGEAMPQPVTPAEASLEQSKKDTAQALADEKIKPESLPRANDPRFSAVAAAQQQVAAQADKAPAAFRAKESAILGGAKAQAGGVAARGSLLLAGTRGRGNAQVLTRQQQQAQKEEEARKKVATDIEAIFTRTKSKVESRLANLDNEVAAIFDPGVDAALNTMKSFVDARIARYKLERYLTIPIVGLARWLRDQALGLPEEVNAFYVQGRAVFQAAMDRLIDRVANLVETRLAQAKADVAAGQAEIKSYVAGLPANLKAAGQAAEKAVGDRFAELTSSIEDKKSELASSLAQKYKEAFDKADEALKQMQDENKGLLQQFAEKLGEVLKALAEFKARLMAVLRKGADTINRILEDPGQFLSNLLAAIKQGFQQFAGNILTHLARGFAKWLFGALAGAGIEIPSDLTLPSILKLVLGVLGITYERMRAKAVRLIGERAVGAIEKVVEYISVLVKGGPAALWEKVKEDLSDLKAMVIDAIKDWLITTIVKRAVAKVVSMFNPVGAIIQIILMIVSVVQFVIERAAQIMEFVEAVVNSFAAIASGAVGGAASWIERALGNMVPILIGFLASLLGLGGISAKIKETILKVQNKVDKAIDKAIAKVVALVKKLFGKGKDVDPEMQKKIDAGKLDIDKVVAKHAKGVSDQKMLDADLAAVKVAHPIFKSVNSFKKGKQYLWRYVVNPTDSGPVAAQSPNWNVDGHPVKAPPAAANTKGESHHVPQKVLLAHMGDFYLTVAPIFQSFAPTLANSMQAHGNLCRNKNQDGGTGLSAIWLTAARHDVAHQPVKLADVISQAQKMKQNNESLQTPVSGGIAQGAPNLTIAPTGATLPQGFSIIGRTPDSGTQITQVSAQVQRRVLYNPLERSLAGTSQGYSADAAARQKQTIAIANKEKNAKDAEKLKNKAVNTFKAQWNGLMATGLTGVQEALKDDPETSWRSMLTAKAKATWLGIYMDKP